MSILTSIDGIPLYSTQSEAVQWARNRGLVGFHTHIYNNQVGYMGGTTHAGAVANTGITTPPTTSTQVDSTMGQTNNTSSSNSY